MKNNSKKSLEHALSHLCEAGWYLTVNQEEKMKELVSEEIDIAMGLIRDVLQTE